ncbi:MAG: hypothetical protein JWP95_1746 [Actinotalea sp.]|nr:hypothetical protein [Actinotalea sp.]
MTDLVLVGAALLVGAASQAMTGIGLGLVSGAILALVLGRETTVPLLAVLSMITLLPVLVRNWSAIRWKDAALLIVPAVLLTGPFVALFSIIDPTVVARISGLGIVVAAVVLAVDAPVRGPVGRTGAIIASTLSSALNVAAGTGSPPVALYAISARWSTPALRGTLQVYFLAICIAVLVTMPIVRLEPRTAAVCAAAVAGGTAIGLRWGDRIPPRAARAGALALSAVGGLVLMTS